MINGKTYQLGYIPFVLNLFWAFGAGHFLIGNFKWGFLSLLFPMVWSLMSTIAAYAFFAANSLPWAISSSLLGILGLLAFYTMSLMISYEDCKRLMADTN